MKFDDVLNHDDKFRYMLLSRMKSDCDYYLGNGNRYNKHLWAGDEVKQIAYMKALWNSFGENDKPEWLSYEQLLDYEKKIGISAILVEMDYKGYYERFALTPEEFEKEFPETFERFGPIEESNSDTIRPLVHIWFKPCIIGDASWDRHFTDMGHGLPESDIESGNLAYIDHNQMQSLSKYLEDVSVYHCRAVCQGDNYQLAINEFVLQLTTAVDTPNYKVTDLRCVEEGPADGVADFSDLKFFTFEFDIKMPRDSQIDIKAVLDNVGGGELLSQHYERFDEGASLADKIKDAQEQVVAPNGMPAPEREDLQR